MTPSSTARHLAGAAGLSLLIVIVSLILSGQFDPHPAGPLVFEQRPGPFSAAAESTTIHWLATPLPSQPSSAQLTAAYAAGAIDSGYGLVIGSTEAYLATAVSPTGMVSIWQVTDGTEPKSQAILPWQPWPHVHTSNAANELWLELNAGTAVVRINRELLWSGAVDSAVEDGRYGLIALSFADEPATAIFDTFRLFTQAAE